MIEEVKKGNFFIENNKRNIKLYLGFGASFETRYTPSDNYETKKYYKISESSFYPNLGLQTSKQADNGISTSDFLMIDFKKQEYDHASTLQKLFGKHIYKTATEIVSNEEKVNTFIRLLYNHFGKNINVSSKLEFKHIGEGYSTYESNRYIRTFEIKFAF